MRAGRGNYTDAYIHQVRQGCEIKTINPTVLRNIRAAAQVKGTHINV